MSSAPKKTDAPKAKKTGQADASDKPETTKEDAPNGAETDKNADELDLAEDDTAGLVNDEVDDDELLETAQVEPLRDDGPTLEEYVAAGYSADRYPPKGYAKRSTSIRRTLTESVQEAARAAHTRGDHATYAALQHFEIALGDFKRAAKTAAVGLPPDTDLSDFLSHGIAAL